MKVVYKRSILNKLIDAIAEARLNGKEIEKIVLTKDEAYELQRHFPLSASSRGGTICGVLVEVEGKP